MLCMTTGFFLVHTLGTLPKPMAQQLFTVTEHGVSCEESTYFEYVFRIRYQALCIIGINLTLSKSYRANISIRI